MSPKLRHHSSRIQAMFPTPAAAKYPKTSRLVNQPVQCGICRTEVAGEGLHRHSDLLEVGSYCSPRCLCAVDALAALQLWSAKLDACGRRDEAELRTTLADDLLLAWRGRTGPDPRGVIAAVELAQSRDTLGPAGSQLQ